MDPEYLEKLKEEQKKGLAACGQKIQQWNKFKDDYESLKSRLETLADNVSHDVMVPFGPQAMMPGKLVHTNEVLVLLGDNWFAERSGKQASEIADRRIKHCQKMLDDLEKEKKQYDNWLRFTGEIQGDGVEILEEYDAEKEKAWRERHRKYLQSQKKNSSDTSSIPEDIKKDVEIRNDEFITRLNQLQLVEDDKNELNELDVNDDSDDEDLELEDGEKRVRWKDQITDKQNRITFIHHKMENTPQTSQNFQPSTSDVPLIQSPSDIYKCFEMSIQKEEPKSILKVKSNSDVALPKKKPLFDDLESIPIVNVPETYPLPKFDQLKVEKKSSASSTIVSQSFNTAPAFSGEVKERDPNELPQAPQVQAQSKPISKFKAFRQEKKK